MAKQIQVDPYEQGEHITQQGFLEIYSGALPDPDTLFSYRNAGETFPERIMQMAESHNAADVTAKNRLSLSGLINPILGQVFTLVFGICGIIGGVYLTISGYSGVAIAAMAGVFPQL